MSTADTEHHVRILMILPQEFMAYNGSGIQVRNRLMALAEHSGIHVVLLAPPFGVDPGIPELELRRTIRLPFSGSSQKIGPSLKKIVYDGLLAIYALYFLLRQRFNIVYTHEEVGLCGALFRGIRGCKHVKEMHSFLPQGLCNYGVCAEGTIMYRIARVVERFIVGRTDLVIAISPDIETQVRELDAHQPIAMIENCFVEGERDIPGERLSALEQKINPEGRPVAMYTGNMSEFQGVDVFLDSLHVVLDAIPNVRYVLVGLQQDEIERCRHWAEEHDVVDNLLAMPQVEIEEMPVYLKLATCLVSPRKRGSNTPYKLYTYMAARKPIVATDILSHTSVVTPAEVFLVEPTSSGLAGGIIAALTGNDDAENRAKNAYQLYCEEYSWPTFKKKVQEAINGLVR